MDHERAFLQVIQDEPDDDVARLVYADWLDDHDRTERAAFIRAQVRAAALPEDDPARAALEDEADDLLATHEEEWSAPLRELALAWDWRRGFIERAVVRADTFLDRPAHLFAAAPLRDLRLIVEQRDLPGLAQSHHLNWLEALDLSTGGPLTWPGYGSGHLRDRAVQALLESPYLTRLTKLNLSGHGIEGPAIHSLVHSPLFGQLAHLDLSDNIALGDRAGRALAEARAERLQTLRLRGTNLTRTGAQVLFGMADKPGLRELDIDLRLLWAWPGRDPLAELRHLLQVPLLGQLEFLNLVDCRFDRPGMLVREIMGHPRLAGITNLNLSGNNLGAEGARALAESPHLSGLRSLCLRNNNVRDTGARALAGAPQLKQLRALDLAQNNIGGPGLRALAEAPTLAGLRELDLSDNFVGPTNVPTLTGSPTWTRLRRLALASANLNTEAIRALAAAPALASLRWLDLGANSLGDEGARALASSPYLRHLRELHLRGTQLSATAVEALLRGEQLSQEARLDLRGTQLGPADSALLHAAGFGKRYVL